MFKLLFFFLSFLAILSAIMVVLSRNPVYSVLYLIVTFFSIAGHYLLLKAQFLAVVHIIVYAGAIMVLFLYVIMLLNLNKESEPHKSNLLKLIATLCAGLTLLVLVASLSGADTMVTSARETQIGMVKTLGNLMFSSYLLPFEVTSLLLLAAMVGAVLLGKSGSAK